MTGVTERMVTVSRKCQALLALVVNRPLWPAPVTVDESLQKENIAMINRGLRDTLVATVVLSLLAIMFMRVLSYSSSASRTAICAAHVRVFADYLKESNALGTLPSTQREFEQGGIVGNVKVSSDMLICPFEKDRSGACSYVYSGPSTTIEDSQGKSVVLYCSATHPDPISKLGEETRPGYKMVIRPDFSVEAVDANEVFTVKEGGNP